MNSPVKLNELFEDLSPLIGDVEPEHVETFWRDGVVHIPGFVKPELCERVIQHFMDWSGIQWKEWPSDKAGQEAFAKAAEKLGQREKMNFAIRQDDPWMFNYVTQRKFGEASAKLLKVASVKMLSETLHAKLPVASGHGSAFAWHQDFPWLPIDRSEAIQFWCALVDVTPEMGPMQHLLGSHRSMPSYRGSYVEDARVSYPELFEKFECTKVETVPQGEAVFHHCLTWHTSALNTSDKVRWAMSSYRIDERSWYTGAQNHNTDGLGLKPNERFNHPNFPTVYP